MRYSSNVRENKDLVNSNKSLDEVKTEDTNDKIKNDKEEIATKVVAVK